MIQMINVMLRVFQHNKNKKETGEKKNTRKASPVSHFIDEKTKARGG